MLNSLDFTEANLTLFEALVRKFVEGLLHCVATLLSSFSCLVLFSVYFCVEVSLLAQTSSNCMPIKIEVLGHRNKSDKQVVPSGTPRQFHKFSIMV